MRHHETRKPEREGRLANAGRAADQPGMRNPTALVGVQQCALGFVMTK